jgi:hypothetical protein
MLDAQGAPCLTATFGKMSEEPPPPNRRKLPVLLWILVASMGLAVMAALLPAGSRPIIDKARRIDLETAQIRAALDTYEAACGGFPAGESSAVFRALRGDNPQKSVFLQCRAGSVSSDGSMVDPWGTPYKIYFSGKEPLIRSAGPNKQFDDSRGKRFDDYIR